MKYWFNLKNKTKKKQKKKKLLKKKLDSTFEKTRITSEQKFIITLFLLK